MTTTREVELDDDGWTVWEGGDHVGTFGTEAEAIAEKARLDLIDALDATDALPFEDARRAQAWREATR